MKALLIIALSLPGIFSVAQAANHYFSDKVIEQYSPVTYAELIDHKLVKQQYDYSCGAASLATILNHQFHIEISEKKIIESLLASTTNPKMKLKSGFSLLDLKKLAASMGVDGSGYAGLTIDELQKRNMPAIIPVNVDNVDHFVVFKGIRDNYVYIGDPLWGNMVLSTRQFKASWNKGLAFFLFDKERPTPNLLDYKHAYLASDWKNAATSNALVIRSALQSLPRF